MINRLIEPSISLPETISFQEVEKIILSNNVSLYVLNAGMQELCKIELVFKAGEIHSRYPVVSRAVNDLLDSGTKTKSAFEIAEAFDFYGAYLQTESNADYASVKLYTLNKHLQNTLPLLLEILQEVIFPEDELQTYIEQNVQRIKVNNEKVDNLARKNFFSTIFNKQHPYGYYTTELDYQNLQQKNLIDFYNNSYLLSNSFILVSGKFSDADLKIITSTFETVKQTNATASPILFKQFQSASAERKIKIEKADAVQSAIRIGKAWHDKTHPEFKEMIILCTVLGGYFGSRLMKNIREDKGYTYGIGCSVGSFEQAGFITISTQVGKDVCEPALTEIYREISLLREELIPENELLLVKNYLFGSFQRSIDGPFALADKFKNIAVYGLDYSYYRDYIRLLKTITPQQLLVFAEKHFLANDFSEAIAG
jgi:zinc protease